MSKVTYTMFIDRPDGTVEIVARGLSAGRALLFALDHGGAGPPRIVETISSNHRLFELIRHPRHRAPETVLTIATVRSPDPIEDIVGAVQEFERIFLSNPSRSWHGGLESDEDFARRRAYERAN